MPSTPSSDASSSKLHFLLLPLPEQGHINPMLALASRLAAHGCTVTFVTAEKAPLAAAPPKANSDDSPAHKLPLTPQHPLQQPATNGAPSADASTNATNTPFPINSTNLRFCTLRHLGRSSASAEPIAAERSRFEILKLTMASLEEQQGMVEKIVQESKASDAPITCIICDILLCHLVMSLAKRQAVLASAFVPCSGLSFYILYLLKLGKRDEIEELHLRFGLMGPTKQETKAEKGINNISLEAMTFFTKLFTGVEEASHVLVNSFEHLESALLEYSLETSELNIKFIGPCLPGWEAGDASGKVGNSMAKQTGCVFSEDEACLPWLDKQEKDSVLLVSFGSEVNVEAEQVQELAMGIEGSGCKFLWVVRPDTPAHNLPQEDFRERTHNVGMFVSWAPQKRVLQHPAVGGFLTHCGWNSTLESMVFGVPMLCFPLNGDQFLNAQLIDERWKVGLRLGPPRTLVPRAEVERTVRDLMGNEDLRLRAVQLQQAAHCAFHESQSSIMSFVQDIVNSVHQKLAEREKRESQW